MLSYLAVNTVYEMWPQHLELNSNIKTYFQNLALILAIKICFKQFP
jgi:hypothetical protein